MSEEPTEPPVGRGTEEDRLLDGGEGRFALHWAWEGPHRGWERGLASRTRAERFLRQARDTRRTASTLRRFLERTWIHGDLTTAEDAEVLAVAARQMVGGHLRVAPWIPPRPDPRGVGGPPPRSGDSEKPPEMVTAPRSELTWIGVELLDEKGDPIASEDYEITLPDGSLRKGKLDAKGRAEEKGVDPGTCKVRFPKIHERK